MHGAVLTPTQRAAHERSRAFRNHIDTLALKLKVGMEAPVPKVVEEAKPDELPRPKKRNWFRIIDDQPVKLRVPLVAQIIEIVGVRFNISPDQICSQRRMAEIVLPRQIAMYLSKEMTPRSLPDIGRRFGGKDHTTVLFAVRKIGRLIESDPVLAREVAELKKLIEETAQS